MIRRFHRRQYLTSLTEWTNRESLLVAIVGIVVAAVLIRLPEELQQDGWLTLVAGREIVWHGLPHVDTLTAWTRGVRWVDQQWLAQLIFYGVVRLGGIKLALLFHALLVASAYCLAIAFARSRGGSARATALVAAVALFPIVMGSWQMRAQSLAFPLFVALFWLVSRDSREPGRRVLLVAPLLVVWANIHGSVVLAAALVALYGVWLCVRRQRVLEKRRRVGLLLLGIALAAPFASPYGLELLSYYKGTLFNSGFSALVVEWGATTPSLTTAPFFVLAFGAVWLCGRDGRLLTRFEQLALLVTLVAGLHAMRNMIWFALVALMTLPVLLGERLPDGYQPFSRIRVVVPALVCSLALVVSGVVAARPTSWFERDYPTSALNAVRSITTKDPSAGIYADERYADWLLWKDPQLRGRIAYDARFELLSNRQLVALYFWRSRIGAHWRDAARGDKVVLVDVANDHLVEKDLLSSGRNVRLYGDKTLAVVERGVPIAAASTVVYGG